LACVTVICCLVSCYFSRWWWLELPASDRGRVPPLLPALCSGFFFCFPACCPFSWRPGWCAGVCLPSIVVVSACMWLWAVGVMERRKKQPGGSVSNPLEQLPAGPKRSAHKIGRTHLCETRTVVGARYVSMEWSATLQVLCICIPSGQGPHRALEGGVYDNHPPSQRHHWPVSQYMHVLKRE